MEKITLTSNNNKTWWSKEDIAELYIKPHMEDLNIKLRDILLLLDEICERLNKLEGK